MQRLPALVLPKGPPKAEDAAGVAAAGQCEVETAQARPGRISSARPLECFFDIDMQHGPNCGAGELKIIVAILPGEPGRQQS